jgi:hypothetical protein
MLNFESDQHFLFIVSKFHKFHGILESLLGAIFIENDTFNPVTIFLIIHKKLNYFN